MRSIYADGADNPTNWYNGSTYTNLTWSKGRQLSNTENRPLCYKGGIETDMFRVEQVEVDGQAVEDVISDNMAEQIVKGFCFRNEEYHRMMKFGVCLMVIMFVFICIISIMGSSLIPVIVILPFFLGGLLYWEYILRYGWDPFAIFEMSEVGIKTISRSPKMQRFFKWDEIEIIQFAGVYLRNTNSIRTDYYVFVRGKENKLIQSYELETYPSLVKNPNRIAIPQDDLSDQFVSWIVDLKKKPIENVTMERKT